MTMTANKLVRRYSRSTRDFLLGFSMFSAFSCANLVQPGGFLASSAHARRFEEEPLPMASQASDAFSAAVNLVPAWTSGQQLMAFLSLALAFAGLFAMNLWFARHVKRVHASYRRR